MAYSIVQNTNNASGASPITATYTSTPTSGNLLLAIVHDLSTTAGGPTVADGNSNAFTLLASNVILSGSHSVYVFGLIAGAAQSSTVTATDGTHTCNMSLYELSGNPSTLTGIVDQSAATNGSGTTSSGSQPSITTTNAGDFLMTCIVLAGTVTVPSVTGSFTLQQQIPSGAVLHIDASRIPGATGTYNPSYSWTSSHSWNQLTFALLPSGGSPPATQPSLMMMGMGA